MADRSITINIGANVQGLVNGLKTADKAAQDWGNKQLAWVQKNEQHLNTLSRGLGVVGAGLTGLALLAVKSFADFDSAMSSVQAATMETAGNMDLLRDAAIEAGARTVYSATEAAGAIEELAKAGVSTADILGGGLDGALDLAASGAIGVSEAAEIAATAMTQFGLGGKDVTHIADLLAAGAGKAQGGVGDLGMALKQAGLVADQTGLSIEETTAGLTAFASAGLVGSDAGTSFKAMLQRLTPQSKEAEKAMSDLGISAYDSQGQFIGLSKFAQNLQDSLKNLTPEQRNAAMATIFGSDAVRAANVLYEQGAKGIDQWTDAVNDQGYAAEQAAIRMDNLKGDLEGLSGSFETLMIGLGESANGPLRSLVQGLDGIVDDLSNMSDGAKAALFWTVGGAGLLTLGAAGAIKMTTALGDTVSALKEMGILSQAGAGRVGAFATQAAKLTGILAAATAVIAAAGTAADALSDKIAGPAPAADELTKALERLGKNGDISELNEQFNGISASMGAIGVLTSNINSLGEALQHSFQPGFTDRVVGLFDSFPGVTSYIEKADERFQGLDASLTAMVQSGNLQGAYTAFREIKDAALEQGVSVDDLRSKFPGLMEQFQGLTGAAESATPAQDAYTEAMNNGGASATQYADAIQEAIDNQREMTNVLLEARDAQRGFEGAVDAAASALAENGATLDITTEKGRENQAALDAIASSGIKATDAMRENGATQTELQAQMQTTRDRFIAAAQAFGMSATEAGALADRMNLIPSKVTPTIAINDQASPVLDSLWTKFNRLDGRTITTNVRTNETTVSTGVGNTIARARGGIIPGAPSSVDNRIAHVATGEFVVNAAATSKHRGTLEAINSGKIPAYADGGYVSKQYTTPAHMAATGSSTGGPAPVSFMPNATIVAADPRAAIKELRAEERLGWVGVPK